jgi:hypothetical protein
MAAGLEETLISVWQQALVESAESVKLENRSFPGSPNQPLKVARSGLSL